MRVAGAHRLKPRHVAFADPPPLTFDEGNCRTHSCEEQAVALLLQRFASKPRTAAHNSALIRRYTAAAPCVRPLCLLVKSWASRRSLNKAAAGTLSSYAHVLSVIPIKIVRRRAATPRRTRTRTRARESEGNAPLPPPPPRRAAPRRPPHRADQRSWRTRTVHALRRTPTARRCTCTRTRGSTST